MKNKLLFPACFLLMLMVENAFADADFAKNAATMSACDIVSSLISEHKKGFASLRGSRADTQYAVIWKAKYNAVGDSCEIWQSGKGNTHYVCTRSAPTKQVADDYYSKAREKGQSCLGNEWSASEAPRKLGDGTKTTFSKEGLNTVVEIHEIKVEGVFKDQWSIYYIVGEPSTRL